MTHAKKRAEYPCYWVLLEWTSNYRVVQPLLEFMVGRTPDHSGVWVRGEGLADAVWDGTLLQSWSIYKRLLKICREVRFAPYVRLKLMKRKQDGGKAKVLGAYRRGRLSNRELGRAA